MRRWAIWIPVLMVASLLYWTVALGLGGMSVVEVSSFGCDGELRVEAGEGTGLPGLLGMQGIKDSYEPIPVNLVESSESADVPADPAALPAEGEEAPAARDQGPGMTAF